MSTPAEQTPKSGGGDGGAPTELGKLAESAQDAASAAAAKVAEAAKSAQDAVQPGHSQVGEVIQEKSGGGEAKTA